MKPDPSEIVKNYVLNNPKVEVDKNSEEYKEEDMRKYDEARNKNFPKSKVKTKEENILASFYIENDDSPMLCTVSMVQQDGWKPISIMVDSGACDCVAPPDTFPGIPVVATTASRDGLEYTAAGGHKIPNLGMSRPVVFTTDGDCNAMTFQIAAISKPLGAVSKFVKAKHRVVFDEPVSYIENKESGKKTILRQTNGVYFLDVWMKTGDHLNKEGFRRQTP